VKQHCTITAKLFGTLLLVYTLLRVVFFCTYFIDEQWNSTTLFHIFYWGLRMDIAALFYLNILFLVYWLLVQPFWRSVMATRVAVILFHVINLPFLAVNVIDLAYFRFNHRRTTVDIADVFSGSSHAFPVFLAKYWYLLLMFIVLCIVFIRYSVKWMMQPVEHKRFSKVYFIFSCILLVVWGGVSRGFAKRPILTSTPLLYVDAVYQPVVNNSTFNLLYSIVRKQTTLEPKQFFSDAALDTLCSIHHQYPQTQSFQKKNVVVFVMESFSKELFSGHAQQSKMPFIDSLMQHSTVCNNAFANALESNKGLSAILASLPDVMDEPIYMSNYSSMPFRGIGHILKGEGYSTNFFMGTEYDHFGFARLCKMVGIDNYYSRDTYGSHPEQFDGAWGIYDEYFLQYFADVSKRQQQPFFSVFFNLSTHYPYHMPKSTEPLVRVPGQKDFQDAATYFDYSLAKLFQGIQQQPWFRNTLFVFIADHGLRYVIHSANRYTEARIPFFMYDPQNPVHQSIDVVCNQLDVMPTILDQLHYSGRFITFGKSIYRKSNGFSLNRLNGVYQYFDSAYLVGYDEGQNKVLYQYNFRQDSALLQNQLPAGEKEAMQRINPMKAVLQRFNNSLINNKLE